MDGMLIKDGMLRNFDQGRQTMLFAPVLDVTLGSRGVGMRAFDNTNAA
jgi:hypothetical protein